MDLNERAELYSTNVALTFTCIDLEKMMNGEDLALEEKNRLREVGSLLCKLDYDSPYQSRSTASEVLAMIIRPYFYRSLWEQRDNWADRQFLDNLYLTLASGGEQALLSKEGFDSAIDLFKLMSKKIFSHLIF